MRTWDINKQNIIEPSDQKISEGFTKNEINLSPTVNWLLHFITANRIPVGDIFAWASNSHEIPNRTLLCNGSSISKNNNSSSFKNIEFKNLFIYLWDNFNDAVILPDGKGISALDDWNDDKTITVPDLGCKVLAGKSNSGTFNVDKGKTIGTDKIILTEPQIPEHFHYSGFTTDTETGNLNGYTRGNSFEIAISIDFSSSGSRHSYTSLAGKNKPHNNVQPSLIVNYLIKY